LNHPGGKFAPLLNLQQMEYFGTPLRSSGPNMLAVATAS
jgi:hypothetical protein